MALFHGLILCLVAVLVSAERDRPDPEEIGPCTCTLGKVYQGVDLRESDYVTLECSKINNTEDLRRVFENARGYHFDNFTLSESTLKYIPHEIFDNVEVELMIMQDITLRNLFDEVPRDPGLVELKAFGIKVLAGWDWEKMAAFKNLENLAIADTPMKKLSAYSLRNVSKKLTFLTCHECRFQELQDDEFADFADLEQIYMTRNAIVDIKRTMFPRRTKLKVIFIEYNKITSIPNDLFSDMPDLYGVSLKGNLISVLPEATFHPVISHLTYINVDGNPIKCDCLFVWVLQYKELSFFGSCYAPKRLHDKNFNEINPDDIRC